MRSFVLLFIALVLLSGCSQGGSDSSTTSYKSAPEFCVPVANPSNPITIEARAQFTIRSVTASGLGPELLGSPVDIKYAEVVVKNNSGQIVQCGQTDDLGLISLEIPKTTGDYTLVVRSRANNSFYKASVLDSPFTAKLYELSTNFSITTSDVSPKNISLPIARATSAEVVGGAFNILNQIYISNVYLMTNTTCPTCTTFSGAPHVEIYWKAGFNPYSYFGFPDSGVSFFYPVTNSTLKKGVYILGGLEGDYDCTDTDHFDNSVIIHEYGHFIESTFMNTDSPGGSHDGNFIIDPRLAWSEGWAYFFQEAILQTGKNRDTYGNASCPGSGLLVNHNMEDAPVGEQDYMGPSTLIGEGVYREVAVTRALVDLAEAPGESTDGFSANLTFAPMWKVLTDNSSAGLAHSERLFKNAGEFYQLLRAWVATNESSKLTDFDATLANEFSLASTAEYAQKLTAQPSCSFTRNMRGTPLISDPFLLTPISNLFLANDFFEYYHDGSASTLTLNYGLTPSFSSVNNLDLYIYKADYKYGDAKTIATSSVRNYPESSGGIEQVSLSNLSPGTYLINVKSNAINLTSSSTYYLSASGVRLCP